MGRPRRTIPPTGGSVHRSDSNFGTVVRAPSCYHALRRSITALRIKRDLALRGRNIPAPHVRPSRQDSTRGLLMISGMDTLQELPASRRCDESTSDNHAVSDIATAVGCGSDPSGDAPGVSVLPQPRAPRHGLDSTNARPPRVLGRLTPGIHHGSLAIPRSPARHAGSRSPGARTPTLAMTLDNPPGATPRVPISAKCAKKPIPGPFLRSGVPSRIQSAIRPSRPRKRSRFAAVIS